MGETMSKNDRLNAIRENAAALRRKTQPVEPAAAEQAGTPAVEPGTVIEPAAPMVNDLGAHFGITVLDQIAAGQAVQHLPIGLIAPNLRPDARQPRFLPQPDELLVNGIPAPEYEVLVAELTALGESLKERQIQPIIVYPGTSEQYPAAQYLILVGNRRWLAAGLIGATALDAIVVGAPTPAERVQLQYAENEERADFTDMERAWALLQMKQALNDAPWEMVEERFRISTSRRHELTRLLTFTAAQQMTLARLRIRENQVEPLHQAIRAGLLKPDQVDMVLRQIESTLRTAVLERRAAAIDTTTIGRMVARAKRAAGLAPTSSPQWYPNLRSKIAGATRDIKRVRSRVAELPEPDRLRLTKELEVLLTTVQEMLEDVAQVGRLPEDD